jgi:hypothetical protein
MTKKIIVIDESEDLEKVKELITILINADGNIELQKITR